MDATCSNCYKSINKQESGGWYRLVCNNDPDGTGVSGFYYCIEFRDKCRKCKNRSKFTYETPCFLCGSLHRKPYFILEDDGNAD